MERQNLLKDVDDCLTLIFIKNNLSKDILNECICGIASVVDKYTIDKRCTAVIPTEIPNVKYARLYVAYLNIAGKSPKTIAQYLRTIKEFNYFIGKSFIDVIGIGLGLIGFFMWSGDNYNLLTLLKRFVSYYISRNRDWDF